MATIHLPRQHGREALQQLREGFWLLLLGVVVCFAFFGALGAFDPLESVAVSAGVGLLAVLYIGHAWLNSHNQHDRDPRLMHDRERRGF